MQPIFARITKVDEETRTVTGRAAQEVVDRDNEIFDYDTSKPEFMKWSAEVHADTQGKSLGNVRSMHGNIAAGKLTNIDFNDVEKAIDVSAKIIDDNEWEKVLEGVHTGFSIGGRYARKWAQPINGKMVQRYTAVPSEISIVDRPCCPTAKFFEVHKRDGSSEKREFLAYMNDKGTDVLVEKGGPGSGPSGGNERMPDHPGKKQERIKELKAHIDKKNRVVAGGNALSPGERKDLAAAKQELKTLTSKKSDASDFAKLELSADGVLSFTKGGPGSGPSGGAGKKMNGSRSAASNTANKASAKAFVASAKANASGKAADHGNAYVAHADAADAHNDAAKAHGNGGESANQHWDTATRHEALRDKHAEAMYSAKDASGKHP